MRSLRPSGIYQKQQALGRCSPGLLHLSGDMDFVSWLAWNGCPRRRPGITAKDWARKLGHRSGSGNCPRVIRDWATGVPARCGRLRAHSGHPMLCQNGPVTEHAKTSLRAVRAHERTRQESYGLGFFKARDCSRIVSVLPL